MLPAKRGHLRTAVSAAQPAAISHGCTCALNISHTRHSRALHLRRPCDRTETARIRWNAAIGGY